jgi:hypothetical protein
MIILINSTSQNGMENQTLEVVLCIFVKVLSILYNMESEFLTLYILLQTYRGIIQNCIYA